MGIIKSATIELTTLVKAEPMMIPTAISKTFPFMANSLNSLKKVILNNYRVRLFLIQITIKQKKLQGFHLIAFQDFKITTLGSI